MTSDALLERVIRVLNDSGVPYMIVGSVSSNLYGIYRSTRDADFVLQAPTEAIAQIARALGDPFHLDPQMSFETITGTSRYVLNVEGMPFKVELFLLSDDPHDQERFRRRTRRQLGELQAYFPTAEDVIIMKIRWSRLGKRRKDIEDVRNVLAVQRELDWEYLQHWCTQHGTFELLQTIRAELPEGL